MATATNQFETSRRAEKARAIAEVLPRIHAHIDTHLDVAEWARDLSTETRDVVMAIANAVLRESDPAHKSFGVPSDETWDRAVEMIERAARTMSVAEIFAGLDGL